MTKQPAPLLAHFIANTHLDREWTMDFQHTRKLTAEFLDNLLGLMADVPAYQFLLDSQTVPLEDYLEVRPHHQKALNRLIRAGRIHIGPWYSALDMNCIGGESVTRNLLIGHLVGERHGPVMKVGYTPFGWGQPAQLPQIYREFGMDSGIFYRGITAEQVEKAEFVWTGADGTEMLISRLGPGGRGAFYCGVWREAFYAGQPARLRRDFDWLEKARAFKICDDDNRFDHGAVLQPQRRLNRRAMRQHFRALIEQHRNAYSTPHLAFAHGMDTTMSDPLEDRVMRECQSFLKPGEAFFHSSLPEYMKAVRNAVDYDRLPRLYGEMKFYDIYLGNTLAVANDIISTRSRQKIQTARVETLLTRIAEPFAALAWQLGAEWPQHEFELAWKAYLKCLPHDTIGGCGIDRMEEDARHRLEDSSSLCSMILKESLGRIQTLIHTPGVKKDEMVLTVFNPSPVPRSEVIRAFIDLPRELRIRHFRLLDDQQQSVPHTATLTGHFGKIFRDKTDLALFSHADEVQLHFWAGDVPAMGYKTYVLRRAPARRPGRKISRRPGVMENEHLKVTLNRNGTMDLVHKETGRVYAGLHEFEDTGEVGHAWTHLAPFRDRTVRSRGRTARIRCVENTDLLARYEVRVTLLLPVDSVYPPNPVREYKKTRRDPRTRPVEITTLFTLSRGSKSVDVETRLVNTCRNHRLRVLFPSGLAAAESYAEVAYDVATRRIARDASNPYRKFPYLTFNFLKFAGVSDGQAGLGFIGNGLREYEAVDDRARTLAITLLRACDIRMCTTSYASLETRPGELSQCQGPHVFHYRIFPHRGGWADAGLFEEADRLQCPLLVTESGGASGGRLPRSQSFLQVSGLVLSAVKKSDRSRALIVRVFNPRMESVTGKLTFGWPIRIVRQVTMNEIPVRPLRASGDSVTLEVPAKKVVTLAVTFRKGRYAN